MSFGSHLLEMSFFNTCWNVMWWCTTSQRLLHNSRLKKHHGQSQVSEWDRFIIGWTGLIIHCSLTVTGDYSIWGNPIMCLTKLRVSYVFLYTVCVLFLFLQIALHAELENFKSRKMFILVSTVMTRAMNRPQNPVSLWKNWDEKFSLVMCIKHNLISILRMKLVFC